KLPAGYEQTHMDYALRDYAFQTDELKIPREIARRILPMSILTEFYWLVNLRELMHFLDERLSNRAEQEIRDIAKRMELEFAGAFPITYMAWRGSNA
ncbi:MAG: FAD-dependent thymidylate synthase, partial [Candidatus Izemoplasmatales bacterium]|nr:FAD-dependent thymidylate synthase [Candidatus Izemoplasmatales bacterium]